jgi:hypothetical protein
VALTLDADGPLTGVVEHYGDYIAAEVLAVELGVGAIDGGAPEAHDLTVDGHPLRVRLERR